MVANAPDRILLAVDGESHTKGAVCWALDLAVGLGMSLNPVHVRDPYLKQFYNEIYAQGREEYLEHVQQCLEEKALAARSWFESIVSEVLDARNDEPKLDWTFDVLDGDPAEQLTGHLERGGHSMLVLGRRHRTRISALRSRDLGQRLVSLDCSLPMLIVPEQNDG